MIIWLASYPRSGNTLLRMLLKDHFGLGTHSLYDDMIDIGADDAVSEAVGHVSHGMGAEEFRKAAQADEKSRFLVKTHGRPADDSPAIFIERDGRSSIVSYHHYLNEIAGEAVSLEDVILGTVPFESWSDHYRAWDPRRRPNTLVLRYEDLARRPAEVVTRLADFLGAEPRSTETRSFSSLQALDPRFFRSGNDERNRRELTGDTLALFWFCHGETMRELGYSKGEDDDPVARAVTKLLYGLRESAAVQARLVEEQAQTIIDSASWAARLETLHEDERVRADGMEKWAVQVEALLATERAQLVEIEAWARASDARVTAEVGLVADARSWAEATETALSDARLRAAQLEEQVRAGGERIATASGLTEEMRGWAEASEIALSDARLRTAQLEEQVRAGEERLAAASGLSEEMRGWAEATERTLRDERQRAAGLDQWARATEARLADQTALATRLRQWAEESEARSASLREQVASTALEAAEQGRTLVAEQARAATLEDARGRLEATCRTLESDRDAARADVAAAGRSARRERAEWVELVQAICDRMEAAEQQQEQAHRDLSNRYQDLAVHHQQVLEESTRHEERAGSMAARADRLALDLDAIRSTRLWRVREAIRTLWSRLRRA